MKTLAVLLPCLFLLSCCADSSTTGTEKDIKTTITFNVSGNSTVSVTSPLSLESSSDQKQDTAGTSSISPTTRLQLTEGGSTSAGEASSLTDVVSKLKTDASVKDSNNPKTTTTNNTSPVVKPAETTKPTTTEPSEDTGTTGASKAILWKPVADSGGNLVILIPAAMGVQEVSVTDMSGVLIEKGDYVGGTNPNRPTYRFSKPGKDFPAPCLLRVGDSAYKVEDPTKRNESLPLYIAAP